MQATSECDNIDFQDDTQVSGIENWIDGGADD